MALTDLKIRKEGKPKDKEFKLFDSDGLFLLVKPNGKAYWKWKYRFLGKEKKLSLGKYPEVSLKEVRIKRLEAGRQVDAGIDPSQKKRDDKRKALFEDRNSFYSVAQEWLETKKEKVSDGHANKLWRALENHVFPTFGSWPINKIEPMDVLNCIKNIEEQGKTEISKKVLQCCHQVFSYAFITKRVKYNPASDLSGFLKKHEVEHYPCIPVHEVPEFLEKLEVLTTSKQNKIAMRFLMYTFVRTGEMRKCKWDTINWKDKVWYIPAEIMKMKQPHQVPLSKQVVSLLKELKEITKHCPHGYMFPSQNRQKNPIMSENTINQMIAKMGYKGRMVGHGFRSLASTNLNEMSFSHNAIERQLAHKEPNLVVRSYNHAEYMPERTRMMQEWADCLDSLGKN